MWFGSTSGGNAGLMRAFSCPNCSQLVPFEGLTCLACGTALGFSPAERRIVAVGGSLMPCANSLLAGCNWLVGPDQGGGLCLSCGLTRTLPHDHDLAAAAWARTTSTRSSSASR